MSDTIAKLNGPKVRFARSDDRGRALEIVAVEGSHSELLVIHAMELRDKYRKHYEETDDQIQDG